MAFLRAVPVWVLRDSDGRYIGKIGRETVPDVRRAVYFATQKSALVAAARNPGFTAVQAVRQTERAAAMTLHTVKIP